MAESSYINITDDFDVRKIYEGIVFYSRDSYNKDKIEIVNFKADNIAHQWREDTFKIIDAERNLKSEVTLTYYSFPCEIPEQGLPIHTLEIIIRGEDQARKFAIKKLGIITGVDVEKYVN